MMTLVCRTAATLTAVHFSAAAAWSGPAALPKAVFPAPFGINIHFTDEKPGEVAKLAEAYRVARMDLSWANSEKTRGKYDFSPWERLVDALEKNGVQPMFILDYGNDLYQQGPPRKPEARAAYTRWAAAAVEHFKGHRILWEIWNEPNVVQFWGGKPNPAEYAQLVKETIPAIRKRVPDATIAVGAFGGFAWEYIEAAFKGGILAGADAVTVHPYRSGYPESVASDYARLRFLISKYSPDAQLPILSGEWGYHTAKPGGVAEDMQASYLVRQRLINASQGINLSVFYDWKEDGPNPSEPEHRYGSLRADLKSKPAYVAARVMTQKLAGFSPVRMLREGPQGYVLLLQNKTGDAALAVWTTANKRSVRVPGPKSRVVDLMGGEEPEWVFGERVVNFGTNPRYILLGRSDSIAARGAWTWITPNAMVTSGASSQTALTLKNPTGAAREYRVALSMEGGQVEPDEVNVKVGPGETKKVPVRLTPLRRELRAVARAEVTIKGPEGTTTDRVSMPLTVRNPMQVTGRLVPGVGAEFTIVRPGPANAESFSVALTDAKGKVFAAKPITLTGRETVFTLPVKGRKAGEPFGLKITDAEGRQISGYPTVVYRIAQTFEGSTIGSPPSGIAVHGEGDAKLPSKVTLRADKSERHGTVVSLSAQFPNGWKYYVVTPKDTAIPAGTVAVGMWVNGDDSGDYLRCRFQDAKGQMYQPTYGQINWKGWRWVTFRLDDASVGSWGGPQDGVIHQPIRWNGIFLVDSGTQRAHSTKLQLDDLTYVIDASKAGTAGP